MCDPGVEAQHLVPLPVMPPSFWVASTKPEAALARGQGWQPWQERGWALAPRDRGPEAGMYCWTGHLAHFRKRSHGDGEAGGEDDQGAGGGKQANEPPFEARPLENLLREDGDQADAGDAQRQAGAERDDQQHPEGHAVQRDRSQQDDERGRTRQQATGDPDRDQRAAARTLVLVVMVAVAPVPVAAAEDRGDD